MPVETRATRTFSFRYQLCISAFPKQKLVQHVWEQAGWANFGSPCCSCSCSQASQCLRDPSLHPLPWEYLLCSWRGNFREGRKKRESSKPSLCPGHFVSVQGSPLIRGWGFLSTCSCRHRSSKCKRRQCFWDPSWRAVGRMSSEEL